MKIFQSSAVHHVFSVLPIFSSSNTNSVLPPLLHSSSLLRSSSPPGIDANMCCGTHVSNLADIQCVKLLYTESKRGSTLLYYMAGDRVTQYLTRSLDVERNLNKLLRCGYHISLTLFCYQRLPTHTHFFHLPNCLSLLLVCLLFSLTPFSTL